MRRSHLALALVALAACNPGVVDRPPEPLRDAGIALTAEERALLESLSPAKLPPPPRDSSNRFADDPKAAALGQRLFFETAFSGRLIDGDNDGSPNATGVRGETGKVSCASCHVARAGFLDDRTLGKEVSLGAGWGIRRTPSLLDVGQASLLMWDGRHDTLYNQPFGPIESPVEFNSSRLFVAQQLYRLYRADYESVFGAMPPLNDAARFPPLTAQTTGCLPSTPDIELTCNGIRRGMPGDKAEFDAMSPQDQDAVTQVVVNFGKAIGAYERLLSCGPGRFDAWVHGKTDALTPAEQRGAKLFVGRGKCVECHSGPYLSDQKFYNVGLLPKPVAVVILDANDRGAALGLPAAMADPLNVRGKFSDGDDGRLPAVIDPAHEGAFRVPMLRCGAMRPTFMHTGQMHSLAEVVAFFSKGGDRFGYPGVNRLKQIDLNAEDQSDLVAFLKTLDGPGPDASLLAPR